MTDKFIRSIGLSVITLLLGCASEVKPQALHESLDVEIGIPDKDTRRIFLPLESGGEIYFFKGLQVEEFVMLALRLEQHEPKAFVEVTVENMDMGTHSTREAWDDPEPFECTDDEGCTLVPVLLPARELGQLTELDGAHLRVHSEVWLEDGTRGEASIEGLLRPQR
ncbi:MAG TPA: hypothetical protein VJV78_37695 [Polyangiales bacterium]|nr:hypothetical protein [Polyangiales bacterium]